MPRMGAITPDQQILGGFAEPGAASLGLLGMRERAAALGGTITVTGIPGGGTRVAVRIPAQSA